MHTLLLFTHCIIMNWKKFCFGSKIPMYSFICAIHSCTTTWVIGSHRECILYSYVEMLIQMFLFFVSSRIISFVSQFSSSFFPVCFVATERETVFFVLLLPHIHNTQPYCCFVSSMADSNSSTVISERLRVQINNKHKKKQNIVNK